MARQVVLIRRYCINGPHKRSTLATELVGTSIRSAGPNARMNVSVAATRHRGR